MISNIEIKDERVSKSLILHLMKSLISDAKSLISKTKIDDFDHVKINDFKSEINDFKRCKIIDFKHQNQPLLSDEKSLISKMKINDFKTVKIIDSESESIDFREKNRWFQSDRWQHDAFSFGHASSRPRTKMLGGGST